MAIKADNKNPYPHIELARSLSYKGLLNPEWDNLHLAGRIKEELDIAIKRDSTITDAWFLYGLWNRAVSKRSLLIRKPFGLGDASDQKAIESFERAIELDDKNAEYQLELAVQYLTMEDIENTKKNLLKVINMKNNLYTQRFIEQAENMLKQLEDAQ